MIHHRNLVAEAAERAIANAQERIAMIDVMGLACGIYLTFCIFSAAAR